MGNPNPTILIYTDCTGRNGDRRVNRAGFTAKIWEAANFTVTMNDIMYFINAVQKVQHLHGRWPNLPKDVQRHNPSYRENPNKPGGNKKRS